MPEATGAGAGQAPADAQAQAATTTTSGQEPPAGSGQAPAAGSGSGTTDGAAAAAAEGGETTEQRADRLERELAETRREAAGHRTKAQTLEREKLERERAGQTAEEQQAAKLADLERENAELKASQAANVLRAATASAAAKLGFRNPDIAYRLLEPGAIEYNDTGEPKNLEHLLRAIATAEPYLTSAAGQDFGGGNRGGTAAGSGEPSMNELLHSALKGR